MQLIRAAAYFRAEPSSVDGNTRVIASTDQLARDGHIVEPGGLQTANFLRSSSIHFNHDVQHPVAAPVSADLLDNGRKLAVDIRWPPPGTSVKSDEVRGLVKSGIVRAVSIGFLPIEYKPLDPKDAYSGQRITKADLVELSFTGCPADFGAVVTQRAADPGLAERRRQVAKLQKIAYMYERQAQAEALRLRGIEHDRLIAECDPYSYEARQATKARLERRAAVLRLAPK